MAGDQFRHLKHAYLTLAVEYWLERVVRIDLSSLLFVLQTVLLDVIPKFLR